MKRSISLLLVVMLIRIYPLNSTLDPYQLFSLVHSLAPLTHGVHRRRELTGGAAGRQHAHGVSDVKRRVAVSGHPGGCRAFRGRLREGSLGVLGHQGLRLSSEALGVIPLPRPAQPGFFWAPAAIFISIDSGWLDGSLRLPQCPFPRVPIFRPELLGLLPLPAMDLSSVSPHGVCRTVPLGAVGVYAPDLSSYKNEL